MTNKEKIKIAQEYSHIPTEEIEQDIADTDQEIKDFQEGTFQ